MRKQIMTKHKRLLLDFAFLSGLFLVATSGAYSASLVTNLSLEKQGDFTYFTVFAEDKIEFTHFILPSSGDKPHRIVVDLEDAVHRLPKNDFRNLPPSTVSSIRTSQYQVEPKKITRIVLDLKEPVIYSVVNQKDENRMTLSLSTKKDPPSIFWAADPEALKTKTEFPKNSNIKSEEKKEFVRQESVSPGPTEPSKAEIKPETRKDSPEAVEKPKDVPFVKQKPQIKETETVTGADETKKKKENEMVKKGIEVERETGVPKAPDMAELPSQEVSKASKTSVPQVIPVASTDTSVVQPATILESQAAEEGAAQRESLVYSAEGRRDPFIPVSEKIDFEFGEIPLPAVENLRLVGTLEDYEGYKALLEDDRGYGYLLKSGDKVKNGFVVNVFEDKIFFQIEEYGWSKTISLELPPEY
jgi:hypothetical protein